MKISKRAIADWRLHCERVQEATLVIDDDARHERIQKAKNDYEFFVGYYFPHYAKVKCAAFHIEAANEVAGNKKLRAVYEWARGHGKSVHFNVMIPMWLMVKEDINVMVLVGKSEQNAATLLGDLQAELEYNVRFINDYGEQVSIGSWEVGNFITKNDKAFFALGRMQSPRGIRHKQNRPDYIVLDDIDDDELVNNEYRIGRCLDWILEALFNTLDMGRGRFIAVGNRIHRNSIIANLAEVTGMSHSKVNALNNEGIPSWSIKYTVEDIKEVVLTIGERRAQKELFNNPMVSGVVFKLNDIRYKEPENFNNYKYVISYTDPSFKNSVKSDYKATVVIGKNVTGEYHLLKCYVAQTTVKEMVQWHYEIDATIGKSCTVQYYMESNFLQDLLFDEFKKEGEAQGTHIPIKGDSRKKSEKFQRIESMQGLFARGLFYFSEQLKNCEHTKKLIEQFLTFEKGCRAPDDGPDAVEGCIFILNQKTKSEQPIIIGKRDGTYLNAKRF